MGSRACTGCSGCLRVGGGWACCLRSRSWRGWVAGRCCCTCLPSSAPATTPLRVTPAPNAPPQQQQRPVPPELKLENLDDLILGIEQSLDRLDPSSSSSSQAPNLQNLLAQYEKHKQTWTSFVNSLPKEITNEVSKNGKSLVMPLLKSALSGVGDAHWLGIGFLFIAWSLDNISNMIQNREDCIENLRHSLLLLRKTKEIWEATNIEGPTRNGVLQNSVEIAVRCAIFCTSTLTEDWILRCLKATTIKDVIDMIREDLDRADRQNMELMLRYNLSSNVERQVSFPSRDDDIVGGQDVIRDAITFLKTSSDNTKAVCLHGMGGIGKSFLGLKIFTEFQKSTYRDCRVELQLETQRASDLCDIQKQIVEKVCKHATPQISNLTDGRQTLEKELKQINHPIFLYVDNVLDHKFLPELLPKASDFPKGSRILITSRGAYIERGIVALGITQNDYKLIEVRELQNQQAQQLLWDQLKSKGEHTEISEVKTLEKKVLELCDGLPLALIVVGNYINANDNGPKTVEVWREVENAMRNAEPLDGNKNDELYSRIMFSIENIDSHVKEAFLDMVFYVDFCGLIEWDTIERLVINHGYILRVLCQRALVRKKERSFGSPSTAEIHDVLKALGKRLLKNEEFKRINGWNCNDYKYIPRIGAHGAHEEKLRQQLADAMRRRAYVRSLLKQMPNNALEKVVALSGVTVDACLLKQMPNLRLLHYVDVDVQVECQEKIQPRHLRVVRASFLSTIRVFDWSKCASLKELHVNNLEVLKHHHISMPLEALTLAGFSQTVNLDVIEAFTHLKELRLQSSSRIEFLPDGISSLTALKVLNLQGCGELKSLPQGISRLMRLEVLDLRDCGSVQCLPDGLTCLTGLTELRLNGCGSLQSIPEGIGNLRSVTHFTLEGCSRLESIPEGATGLMSTDLTGLLFEGFTRIQYLPEGVTRLTGLTHLDLRGCRRLRSLPEGVVGLTGLTDLDLRLCRSLQALPEGIASLSGLTTLDLTKCRSLRALPANLAFMTGLCTLKLRKCVSLQLLPDDMPKLTHLKYLDLYGCRSLQSIQGVTTLAALEFLDVRDCTELQLLPEGCTRLTSLQRICLSGCRSLKSIPESLTGLMQCKLAGNLIAAEEEEEEEEEDIKQKNYWLNLKECQCLMSLPQCIGSFTHLERLNLENCTSLQSLPEGVTRLSNLAELNLLGCKSLQCLPSGLIGSLTGLRKLKVGECAIQLQPLLEEVSCNMHMTSLKVLELSGCDLLSLPQEITRLMSLTRLSLAGCREFQLLPQGIANWRGLRRLDLSGCQSLQYLPEELTRLRALEHLNLSGCACLRSLPQGIFTGLAALKSLSMSECGGLQLEESRVITMLTGLTNLDLSKSEHLLWHLNSQQGLASLTGLKNLNLSGCRSLESVPEAVAAFRNLEWLELSGCASLESLSNLPQGSTRLKKLHLGGCASLAGQPSVWETILSFRWLQYLSLSGWETMKAGLPEGIGSLKYLTELDLSKCSSLVSLPEGIGSLKWLRELDLSKCSSLLSLPESVTKLTAKELYFGTEIRGLKALRLAECKSLQSLPPGITKLEQLDELDLSGCTSLEPGLLKTEEFTKWTSGMEDYRAPCLQSCQ